MVTSARSISDFSQTVSCERLPQRIAARMDRSCFTCSTRWSSASLNFFWMDAGPATSALTSMSMPDSGARAGGPRDGHRFPGRMSEVLGQQHDLAGMARIVSHLSVDRQHYRLGLVSDIDF